MIKDLIKKAQQGDIEARNSILEHSNYIIDLVVQKLNNIPLDVSAKRYGAILGLLTAIKNFDTEKGSNFEGYAYKAALDRAKNQLQYEYLVRIPCNKLNEYLSNHKKPYELMSLSNLNTNWPETIWYTPIDDEGNENKDRVIKELIVNNDVELIELKKILKEKINQLDEFEKDAILYKYGFTEDNLEEVGKKHNVSYEWVRLQTKKSLKKLRKMIVGCELDKYIKEK